MPNKIQFKRGLKAALPDLDAGEPGYCTDTQELFVGNSAGANKKVVMSGELFYSVKDYSAVGNGVTDSTAAIQAAVDAAIAGGGGNVYFPPGEYLVTSTITIDLSSKTVEEQSKNINIIGSGSANCTIKIGADVTAFLLLGGLTAGAIHPDTKFEGFKFVPTTGFTGTGLEVKIASFCEFHDLYFLSLKFGMITEDFLSSKLDNVRFRFCKSGMYMKAKNVLSYPNAIDFYRCHFGSNDDYGLRIDQGSQISMFGGSVEANGTSAAPERYGIQIENAGVEGGVGLSLYGVYFENNHGLADIRIVQGTNPATYVINGCNFNRSGAGLSAPNSIRLDQDVSDGVARVIVEGCSFRGFGTYVPNAANQYIRFFASGNAFLDAKGNHYNDTIERPDIGTGAAFAHVRFNGTLAVPTPVNSFNVSGITKNAPGDYTITFLTSVKTVSWKTSYSTDGVGFISTFGETVNSIRFRTFNSAGALTDFTTVSAIVFE